MNRATLLLSTVFGLCALLSCSDSHQDKMVTFKATLNGASESTPNTETGTGSATLVYDDDTNVFKVTVTYSGLTGDATGSHIHKGEPGVAGDVIFAFTNLASPINFTSPTLTTAQEADLKAGLYYVNVHTAAHPGGEIRGQLLQQQ